MEDNKYKDLAVSMECRDLRHSWEPVGDVILIEEMGQVRHFSRTLECSRCDTLRVDEYKISNFSLARVRSHYQYPEGYTIRGGIKIADVRFRMFQNAQMVPIEDIEEDE